MKQLYNARDYFKSALLPGFSSYANECIGFISESFFGNVRNFSGNSSSDLLLSVCTLGGSYLQLVFDSDSGCTGHSCKCVKNDISRKFGLPTDRIFVHSGKMDKPQYAPLRAGDKVAHQSIPTWGTLGGFTIDKDKKKITHIVSNNHVLANSNVANIGDSVFKKGNEARHIGKLQNYVPIQFGKRSFNELDLAVASLDSDEYIDVGKFIGIHNPRVGERVSKTGAMTGPTQGVVMADDRVARVDYDGKLGMFVDQLLITDLNGGANFSIGGDSGSFIFGDNGDFVGLLFAGGITGTSANQGMVVANQLRNWNLLH